MDSMSRLAATIGESEARTLRPHLRDNKLHAGAVLLREGEPASRMYFVVQGDLDVTVGAGESQVRLGSVGPGHWVGEVGLIDQGAATATVRARVDSVALSIDHGELMILQAEEPHAAAVLLRAVTRELGERLAISSSGVLRQVGEGEVRLSKPPKPESWLSDVWAKLVGPWRSA